MRFYIFIYFFLFVFSCKQFKPKTEEVKNVKPRLDSLFFEPSKKPIEKKPLISKLELNLIEKGLVNVQDLDSSILIDIKYSTTDNFMQEDMYGNFNKAYLQKNVAEKVVKAQQLLKEINPELSLLIYDAVRPRHIQQKMWNALDMPISEKIKFVSNPKNGSLHNFGAAVDLTLASLTGEALDMGTAFDYIGELAYPTLEMQNLKAGLLTKQQIENRKLLRKVMYQAGFFNIQTEWWHFNSCYRKEARELYDIVE